MPRTQRSQVQPVKFRCRFDMTAADAPSSHEFCVFDFPGCEGCPKAEHAVQTVGNSEDPMKSEVWRSWATHALAMDRFIDGENLALFKKHLAEARTDAEREVLLKLLAEEEAKDPLLSERVPLAWP